MEANIRDLNLGYTSHSYKRVHLTPGPMQTPETSKSHWLRREVTDISVVLFYTRCWVKSSYSNIKPFLFLFLPFTLALAWKDHVIICLSRTIAKRGNPQIAGFVSKNSDLSINNTTLVGVVCALTGFIFVCGGYHSPWAYKCFDDWKMPLGLPNCVPNYL